MVLVAITLKQRNATAACIYQCQRFLFCCFSQMRKLKMDRSFLESAGAAREQRSRRGGTEQNNSYHTMTLAPRLASVTNEPQSRSKEEQTAQSAAACNLPPNHPFHPSKMTEKVAAGTANHGRLYHDEDKDETGGVFKAVLRLGPGTVQG